MHNILFIHTFNIEQPDDQVIEQQKKTLRKRKDVQNKNKITMINTLFTENLSNSNLS